MSILNRLEEIRTSNHLNKSQFEKSLGKSNGYLNTLRKNESIPGTDVMLKILDNYPNINLNWLLTGEGEMKKLPERKEHTAHDEQDEYQVRNDNSLHEKIDLVNQNVVALSEGFARNMESLGKAVKQGLKNDLKLIQWTERIDEKRILHIADQLDKFLETNKDH